MRLPLLVLVLAFCLGLAGCKAAGQSPQATGNSPAAPSAIYETYTAQEYYITLLERITQKMAACSIYGKTGHFQYNTGTKEGYYYLLDDAQKTVFMVHLKGRGEEETGEETTVTVHVPREHADDWAVTAKIVKAGVLNTPECP